MATAFSHVCSWLILFSVRMSFNDVGLKVDCWCPLFGQCLFVVGVVYLFVKAFVSRCLSARRVAAPLSGWGISTLAGTTTLSAHVAQ